MSQRDFNMGPTIGCAVVVGMLVGAALTIGAGFAFLWW